MRGAGHGKMGLSSIRAWAVGLEIAFLLGVSVMAWATLERVEQRVREDAGQVLQAVLETSHESLLFWVHDRENLVAQLAADPEFVSLVSAQLAQGRSKDSLAGNSALVSLRRIFERHSQRYQSTGFSVIATDGTSLAAVADDSLGMPNQLWEQRRHLMQQAVTGKPVFVPPVRLQGPEHGTPVEDPALYFAAPVVDSEERIIAVLAVRYSPTGLTRILEIARISKTGETYAFDAQGRMLTTSRFEDSLRVAGTLGTGQNSILSLTITDPRTGELTVPVQRAKAGRGVDVDGYRDYRGIRVLGAWMWSRDHGFGLTAEIDEGEALAPYKSTRRIVIAVLAATACLALLLTVAVLRVERRRFLEVRDREEHLRAILDTAADGIATFDDEGTIEATNPALNRMFGYRRGELIGLDTGVLLASADSQVQGPRILQLPSDDKSGEISPELLGRRKDGTTFEFEVRVGESVADNKRQYTAILRDVTERRALEARLVQSQKLEAVGRLAAGVAHDFNNLLMGISGCAQIASKRIQSDAPRPYLDNIRQSAESGAAMTRQLVAVTRKGGTGQKEQSALDRVVDRLEEMLKRLIGRDVSLSTVLSAERGIPACARGQIEQIVINLVVNARDAMPGGGEIKIATWATDISAESELPHGLAPGRYLVLSVTDAGTGMNADTKARIFEPFFTTKPVGKGTGLGLSTVFEIVEDAGGTIELDTEEGKGTEFRVFLPWAGAERADDVGAASAEQQLGGTALLVEDDTTVRMTVRDYLQDLGFHVVEAKDRDEAVDVASSESLDLLVTDIVLPGGDGMLVAEEVRARQGSLPVLMMSAHPADYLAETGRITQGTPLLQKPFAAERLREAIKVLMIEPSAEAHATHRPASPEASTSSVCILLIEDHDNARMATSELLGEEGITVIAAGTAAEALAAYVESASTIDVVVTDIGLPDMAIDELIGELNRIRPIPSTVYISGLWEDDLQIQKLLRNESATYLRKPLDFDALARIIRKCASGTTAAAEQAAQPQ
jgi:PAS domain S-box-containing protein